MIDTDCYPSSVSTRMGLLRLACVEDDHAPESQFATLEATIGLPCDGLVYHDGTERLGRHLVAVFHGRTLEETAIAICHNWRWQWYGGGLGVALTVALCIRGVRGGAAPLVGTIAGDLGRAAA